MNNFDDDMIEMLLVNKLKNCLFPSSRSDYINYTCVDTTLRAGMVDWLNDNVGKFYFLQSLSEDLIPYLTEEGEMDNISSDRFYFIEPEDALLFKLTWG